MAQVVQIGGSEASLNSSSKRAWGAADVDGNGETRPAIESSSGSKASNGATRGAPVPPPRPPLLITALRWWFAPAVLAATVAFVIAAPAEMVAVAAAPNDDVPFLLLISLVPIGAFTTGICCCLFSFIGGDPVKAKFRATIALMCLVGGVAGTTAGAGRGTHIPIVQALQQHTLTVSTVAEAAAQATAHTEAVHITGPVSVANTSFLGFYGVPVGSTTVKTDRCFMVVPIGDGAEYRYSHDIGDGAVVRVFGACMESGVLCDGAGVLQRCVEALASVAGAAGFQGTVAGGRAGPHEFAGLWDDRMLTEGAVPVFASQTGIAVAASPVVLRPVNLAQLEADNLALVDSHTIGGVVAFAVLLPCALCALHRLRYESRKVAAASR